MRAWYEESDIKYHKMENKTGKILGALSALFIIAMLVVSGPAQAFTLNIKVDKSKVFHKETYIEESKKRHQEHTRKKNLNKTPMRSTIRWEKEREKVLKEV